MMEDRYLDTSESVIRLVNDYKIHKNLFVCFDFDNTIFDFHGVGDTFPKLEIIIKRAQSLNCKLILFTGNEGEKLSNILQYLKNIDIFPDFINENPIMPTRKPYYNILLDDRAGLSESYQILQTTLNIIEEHEQI